LDFNIFSVTLLISGMIVAGISSVIIYRLGDSVRWFAITMLLVAIWALAYGFELSSSTLEAMLRWVRIEYVGIAFAPGTWLWFCLKYTGLHNWTSRKFFPLVFGIPILTFLLVVSNPWHHLHYKEVDIYLDGPFPLLAITVGPWYYVHVGFFYISLFTGSLLLVYRFRFAEAFFKNQTYLLLLAGFVPWVFNLVYLFGYRPFEHIDLTPYAFLFMYIFVGIGLLRFELFNIRPIARDKVFEVITKGILVFDPSLRIIDFNPSIKKWIGKKPSEIIGKSIAGVIPGSESLEAFLSKKEQAKTEASLKIGEIVKDYSVEFIPMLGSKSNVTGMLVLFEDITQEKSIQNQILRQSEELKNMNSLKDKLFSIISHDLKGPIFGIRELIKLSQNGDVSRDDFFDILPEINKSMDSVSILLENLLAWTSSQMKGEFIQKKFFDLEKLVDQEFDLFENMAKEKGITLRVQRYGNLEVFADKNMIDLSLRNLISNAIKFSGKGDLVTIILKDMGSEVQVKVKDTGLGINAENLEKLRRRESFTTPGKNKEGGTGLGMLLVHEYVKKNGGELQIQSQESLGSEFTFNIPKG
jgi:PAS domain S-box-containing protein